MSDGRVVLTVHALDVSAEEGVIADAAVFAELDCRAVAAATCLVAGTEVTPLETSAVVRQLDAALADGPPRAARIGAMVGAAQVAAIASRLRERLPDAVVFAPAATCAGVDVLDRETLAAALAHVLPLATVLVVRGSEVALLAGEAVADLEGTRRAAAALRARGARAVLIAGVAVGGRVLDVLDDAGRIAVFDATRLHGPRVPGLPGAHAAALAAHLALGATLAGAAEAAQRYIRLRLQRGR